jgi:hypothetical protein
LSYSDLFDSNIIAKNRDDMNSELIPLGASGPPEKGEHKMDKFKDHLVNGAKLNSRDQMYFEKMKKAWSWTSKMFSPSQVVAMLFNEYGHEKTHAYQILRDAYELWGIAYDLDKRGITKVLIEALYFALSIGQRDGDPDVIMKAAEKIAKLSKLDKVDNIVPPGEAMPTGVRVYVVNGDVHVPGNDRKEVIDVDSTEVR